MPTLLAVTAISGLPYNHTSFKPWAPDSRLVINKNVNPTKQIRIVEANFIGERSLNALVKMNRNDWNPMCPKRIGSNLKRSRSKNRMKSAARSRLSAGRNMLSAGRCTMSEACYTMNAGCCTMSEACYTMNAGCCTMSAGCCILSEVCYTMSEVCYKISEVCYTMNAGCCILSEVCYTMSAACCLPIEVSDTLTLDYDLPKNFHEPCRSHKSFQFLCRNMNHGLYGIPKSDL